MNYIEIINKKENNQELNYDELSYVFNGYLNNLIDDNNMTRLLRAICTYGLNEEETFNLTDIFIKSGDQINLSNLGLVVDKHSTGGVGDKLTLIVGPIVASCNVKIAKMSGRALGHTGGTIDKLESISGFKVDLSEDEFVEQINNINIAITSQTANVVPMDKKVYALRDITNTTMSIPLIASSIMSKKIACGADKILLDVKVGNGALITNLDDAEKLAQLMIKIGQKYHREVRCMLTNMDIPLGHNIGNGLEVIEALDVLNNHGEKRLTELSIAMATELVSMGKNISKEEASILVKDNLTNLKALEKFKQLVQAQHGNLNSIAINNNKTEIKSLKEGYLNKINALELGKISNKLGAGRINKNDAIDYGAGIIIHKGISEYINEGDILCTLYTSKNITDLNINQCFEIDKKLNTNNSLIYKIIN